MKTKQRIKHIIDLCMAVALLLLMAYSLIGEEAHEWIGMAMFALVIVHNILNISWYRNLFKGRYTPFRIFQLLLDLSIVLSMIGLMVSGIMMSNYVFSFLPIDGGVSFARTLHMICAYWGFVLMSFHVGLHTNMMMAVMRKAVRIKEPSKARTIILRMAAALLCVYGVYAFIQRQIGSYMFLRTMFVFFDFNEPLAFFFIDYIVIMGMLICIGHYISGVIRKIPIRKSVKESKKIEEDSIMEITHRFFIKFRKILVIYPWFSCMVRGSRHAAGRLLQTAGTAFRTFSLNVDLVHI